MRTDKNDDGQSLKCHVSKYGCLIIALFTVYLWVCKLLFWLKNWEKCRWNVHVKTSKKKMLKALTSALHERKASFSALTHGRHQNENFFSGYLISSLWNAQRLNAKITYRNSSIPSWLSQVITNSVTTFLILPAGCRPLSYATIPIGCPPLILKLFSTSPVVASSMCSSLSVTQSVKNRKGGINANPNGCRLRISKSSVLLLPL